MNNDREIAQLFLTRNRLDMPADERREVQAGLHSHFYDPSKMRGFVDELPQGMEESHGMMEGIAKSVEMVNRNRRPEAGLERRTVFDDPLFRWTDVPGTLHRKGRIPPWLLYAMADQDPIIQSILQNLKGRVKRHVKPVESGVRAMLEGSEGFDVIPTFKPHTEPLTDSERLERLEVVNFIVNSGDAPRFTTHGVKNREDWRRESLDQMFALMVDQRFVTDAIAIEIVRSKNRRQLKGLYAVDGATIVKTDARDWPYGIVPEAVENPDAAFVQVVQNRIYTTLGSNDLYYHYANSRDRMGQRGYGFSETEMSIKLTTGILNVLSNNNALFDRNAVPPGILSITGQINDRDLIRFKQEWDAYRLGSAGMWQLPILNPRSEQSKLSYLRTDSQPSDMVFSSYVSFLAAIRCAIIGVDVTEINISPYGGNNGALSSGKDTQTRVDESKNRAVTPLVELFFRIYDDIISPAWNGRWKVVPVGLVKEDPIELRATFLKLASVDEARQILFGLPPHPTQAVRDLPASNPALGQQILVNTPSAGSNETPQKP